MPSIISSLLVDEHGIIVGRNSPVLRMVILVGIVLLVIGEEVVELEGLLEVLNGLQTSDVLEEVEVAVNIDTSSDESVPVDGLKLDVGVVLLELEVDCLSEVNVWALDSVHVFTGHLKLVEIKVFREHLHLIL